MSQFKDRQLVRIFSHLCPDTTIISAVKPHRGSMNNVVIINNSFVLKYGKTGRLMAEKKAIEILSESETCIPVPMVTAFEYDTHDAKRECLVMTKVPGVPLIDMWAELAPAQKEALAYQAGVILAHMHQVSLTEKYRTFIGDLAQHPVQKFTFFFDYYHDYLTRIVAAAFEKQLLNQYQINAFWDVFSRHIRVFTDSQSSFVHNDYHWENILTDGQYITGIIDFEWASLGERSLEFSIDYRREEKCPGSVKPFREGYQSIMPLTADDNKRALFHKMALQIEFMVDFLRRNDHDAVATVKTLFSQLLSQLS